MRIRNLSSYPTEMVEELIDFGCKGIKLSNVLIIVMDGRHAYQGKAHGGAPSKFNPGSAKNVIRLWLGKPSQFPIDNLRTKTYWRPVNGNPNVLKKEQLLVPYGGVTSQPIYLENWMEALVSISAHEAKHIYQFRHGKRLSEVKAERHAAKRLEAYRQLLEARKIAAHL